MTASRASLSSPALNPVSSSPGTIIPSSQSGGTTTDPSDLLAVASDYVRDVWRQIEFPAGWTTADSAKLLVILKEANERKGGKYNRYWPQPAMDMGSKVTQPYCLAKDLKRLGMQARQDCKRVRTASLAIHTTPTRYASTCSIHLIILENTTRRRRANDGVLRNGSDGSRF